MEDLPQEMLEHLSQYLSPEDLSCCCRVSHQWRRTFNDDYLWKPHCDPDLEEPLRITPSVVNPPLQVVNTEIDGLEPIGKWRSAYMRETRLRNNYSQCKFVTFTLTDLNGFLGTNILRNDYLIRWFSNRIEMWNIKEYPPMCLSKCDFELPQLAVYDDNVSFTTAGENLLVAVYFCGVRIFQVDLSCNNIVPLSFIYFHESFDFISSGNRRILPDVYVYNFPHVSDYGRGRNPHSFYSLTPIYAVSGTILLAITRQFPHRLHVWNVQSGESEKTELSSSVNPKALCFLHLVHSDSCEDIVVVTVVKVQILPEQENLVRQFNIYSPTLLSFLQFNIIASSEKCTATVHDHYFGFTEDHILKVYNYLTSDLLVRLPVLHQPNLNSVSDCNDVFNNFFVVTVEDKLKLFDPLKGEFCFECSNVLEFRKIGNKYLEIVSNGEPRTRSVWEGGKRLKNVPMSFPVRSKSNKSYTRLVEDPLKYDEFGIPPRVKIARIIYAW